MKENNAALHMDILYAMEGRIRVRFEHALVKPEAFARIPGILKTAYNNRLHTLLLCYDSASIKDHDVIIQAGAIYASQCRTALLHIRDARKDECNINSTGTVALAAIITDIVAGAANSVMKRYTSWIAAGLTTFAVIEHGYQELRTRGNFDPEVMSVVYLMNSIGTASSTHASALAWLTTYGRHILPKDSYEQAYIVKRKSGTVTLVPIREGSTNGSYAGTILRKGAEVIASRGYK